MAYYLNSDKTVLASEEFAAFYETLFLYVRDNNFSALEKLYRKVLEEKVGPKKLHTFESGFFDLLTCVFNDEGESPLSFAIRQHRQHILLLSYQFHIKITKDPGTILYFALIFNQTDDAIKLISEHPKFINIRFPTPFNDGTALHAAVTNNNARLAEFLLSRNALVSFEDKTSQTPLYYAFMLGYTHLVKLLLMHGANLEQIHFFEQKRVELVIQLGHLSLVDFLLKNTRLIWDPEHIVSFFKTSFTNKNYLMVDFLLTKFPSFACNPANCLELEIDAELLLKEGARNGFIHLTKWLLSSNKYFKSLSIATDYANYYAHSDIARLLNSQAAKQQTLFEQFKTGLLTHFSFLTDEQQNELELEFPIEKTRHGCPF